jgi:hypothetical protein
MLLPNYIKSFFADLYCFSDVDFPQCHADYMHGVDDDDALEDEL